MLGKTCFSPRAPRQRSRRTEPAGTTVTCKFPEAFFHKEKGEVYHQVLRRMTAALPGWRGADLGLGHCWLAVIDFGRRKTGTGSCTFRKNCSLTPAPPQCCSNSNRVATVQDRNPPNLKYRLFIAARKRLSLRNANLRGQHAVPGIV